MSKTETDVIDGEVMDQSPAEPKPSRAVAKAERTQVANKADPLNMISMAIQKGAGIEVIKEIVALQERLDATNARKAFDFAMAAAKEELPVILKNRRVKYDAKRSDGKVDYAHEDLAQIATQIDPILSKHGLSYRFRTSQPIAGHVTVTCIISHELGYSEENPLTSAIDVGAGKNHIQAIGSATSYLSRYTLKLALGLAASEDDDGRGGAPTERKPPVPSSSSAAPSVPSSTGSREVARKPQPHAIPTKGQTFPSWAKLYIAAVTTADTPNEILAWDKANESALEDMFQGNKQVYAEVDRAVAIHKEHLLRSTVDNTATESRPAPKAMAGSPDIETEYEDWLKWAFIKIDEQTDPDVLESFFDSMVEGNKDHIFPSDRERLFNACQAAEKKLHD